jgi:hypothetical protein
MQQIRRRILIVTVIIIILASTVSLILDTTAPNPTGRWFSSDIVDTSLDGQVFGKQAEILLGHDLNLPQNDSLEGERRCFCNVNHQAPPGRCNVCEAKSANISTWSIPDFISDGIIVDSKAVAYFAVDEQIRNFIEVTEIADRELWIYVRKDTIFSDTTRETIQATGGDIIPYFVVAAYSFWLIIEQAANNLLLFAIIIAVGLLIWEYIAQQRHDDSAPSKSLPDEVERAEDSVEETERYMQRMERLSKKVLKDEDKDD